MALLDRVVQALFGASPDPASPNDQKLVEEMIEVVVEAVEPRVRLRSGYRAKLADGARLTIAHLREIGRIQGRYETFTLHVKRHIRGQPLVGQQPNQPPNQPVRQPTRPQAAAAAHPDPAPSEPRRTPPPSVGGFTFNATPKKEDLF